MQTVPSLIGAGTAVAAAATGLVFGQLAEDEQHCSSHRSPASNRRKLMIDHHFSNPHPLSRSGSGSATSTPLPTQNQAVLPLRQSATLVNATSARPSTRRRTSPPQVVPSTTPPPQHSPGKQGDLVITVPLSDNPRDSASSNGSWIRRFSLRPLSQHGSLRSSTGPDSPSLFSFGSAAPILPASRDRSSRLSPNKLVKRAPGSGQDDAGLSKRRGSRAQMTLRRPATSHQRSATLQHQLNAEELASLSKTSFDLDGRPRTTTLGAHQRKPGTGTVGEKRSGWKSFWHNKLSNPTKAATLRGVDGTSQTLGRRVRLEQHHDQQIYLVTPDTLLTSQSLEAANDFHEARPSPRTRTWDLSWASETNSNLNEATNEPKRSISIPLSSPTIWMSKVGSLRHRRGGSEIIGGKRRSPTPSTDDEDPIRRNQSADIDGVRQPIEVSQAEVDLAAIFLPPRPQHRSPSPLSPLSQHTNLHLDLPRLRSSSSVTPDRFDEAITSPSISSRVNSHGSNTRTLERASTVASSEYHRDFTSGDDDDDTDFKTTDTPFDSFRTVASDRKRVLDNPLDLMFENLPPGTESNNNKPKRLSIQDILGPSFGGSQITEEEESIATPVRGTYEEFEERLRGTSVKDDSTVSQVPAASNLPVEGNYSRLSLDDDDDDLGWAREDEEALYNRLSPPSSMNSRRGSPRYRTALGRPSRNTKADVHFDSARERPRSTVFDWTDPPAHDKREKNSHTLRPKTVHGKQEMDLRGGRIASRKGFIPIHVRSQSVPIAPDLVETKTSKKPNPKFGTWGLGKKNISEDWDDDFEFDEDTRSATSSAGTKKEKGFSMVVPASIQATQPTVRAHSGQIRELSLLVNDLKRLCRLGRDMNMLVGPSIELWHEAEGIIALASPDEDAETTETTDDSDFVPVDDEFTDKGFDGTSLIVKEEELRKTNTNSRRRSVFSPEDDIFGNWDHINEEAESAERTKTPESLIIERHSTDVARSVVESMRSRHATFATDDDADEDDDTDDSKDGSTRKLNFDTNSLKELVKRAGDLRDKLSELIRREDYFTPSPARTLKYTRSDGSPAFTRVFDEPTSSPTRRASHPNKPGHNTSVNASSSKGISRRMQMMMVS